MWHIRGSYQWQREGPIIKRQIEILKAPKDRTGKLLEHVAVVQVSKSEKVKS